MKYLVVGQGIAGTAIAFTLLQKGHFVKIYRNTEYPAASYVASGLWNPVVLKRMNLVWKGLEMEALLEDFYTQLQEYTQAKFYFPQPILRLLHSAGEANDWMAKSSEPSWENILLTPLQTAPAQLDTPLGKMGELQKTGWVHTTVMLDAFYQKTLADQVCISEKFDYNSLEIYKDSVAYLGEHFDAIIFAEGTYAKDHNPFFPKDVFRATKGVVLTVKCPDLQMDKILHFAHFVIPMGNDTYRLGATYDWKNLDTQPHAEAVDELMQSLSEIHTGKIELMSAAAGIRPNTKDRKALVGSHPEFSNMFFINGLGSRGILMAPFLVNELLEHIFTGAPITPEIDVKRFFK